MAEMDKPNWREKLTGHSTPTNRANREYRAKAKREYEERKKREEHDAKVSDTLTREEYFRKKEAKEKSDKKDGKKSKSKNRARHGRSLIKK